MKATDNWGVPDHSGPSVRRKAPRNADGLYRRGALGGEMRPLQRIGGFQTIEFPQGPGGLTIKHDGIERSVRYIYAHYCCPIRISDLEKVAGLSRRGFLKAFRKHTGLSPVRMLRQLRVEHAKQLLVETDQPLEQLAARCGFRSANSFWVAFRQVARVTPKQFQRQAWLQGYRPLLTNRTARAISLSRLRLEFNS